LKSKNARLVYLTSIMHYIYSLILNDNWSDYGDYV